MKTGQLLLMAVLIVAPFKTLWAQATTEQSKGYDGESEANRENKKYQALAIITGAGPNPTSSTGISLGYHLDMNRLLLIEAVGGESGGYSKAESDKYDLWNTDYKAKGKSIGVHFKHFVGNSFYYRTGVDFRNLKYEYNDSLSTDEVSFTGNSVALNFQIGNQWQWDNFTLGCDWVGISVPISHSITDRKIVSSPSLADYYAELSDDREKLYVKNASLNLLRFYLGASF